MRPDQSRVTGPALDIDTGATGAIVTRNRIVGLKVGAALRVRGVSGALIEDNVVKCYEGSSLYIAELTDFAVRRNRLGPHGSSDYAVGNSSHGIQVGYCSEGVIEDNVIYSIEPTNNIASYGIWMKALNGVSLSDIVCRRNLLYRNGLYFDLDGETSSTVGDIEWLDNIVAGMSELHKTKLANGAAYLNAPLNVNLVGLPGGSNGSLNGVIAIDGNFIWRFENDTPDQTDIEEGPHLRIGKSSGSPPSDYFDVDDTLTDWTNNVEAKPDWTADPESGDLRLDDDPVGFSQGTPFTEALSQAWTPD